MARQAAARQATPSPLGSSRYITFLAFEKMNTKVARQNLPENQVAWMENLQPIAPNQLLTVPAPAAALATVTGKTVTRQFQANIGNTDYVIFFATDGSATAVNANSGAQTTFATAATFSNTPDMVVFASQRLLIMDPTGGYATWDGTLFVKSGGISPNIHITNGGAGYTSAPAVTFTGGAGGNAGGAAATAVIAGGAVVAINVTNAGTGNAAGAAITVVLTGGGFSTPATATVVVWPQVTGTTITVGFGRVWWASGRILNFTGTGATTGVTWDDLNPADAAGSTTISDNDLAHVITGLRFLNNYLYITGDQSIKQIGSITVASSVTLFTLLTLASDIGTSFLMTIQSYNRLVLFANKNGVYGIFGATVQKISDDLDGIFLNANFALAPSAALNDLQNIHCYVLLLSYNDPRRNVTRSILLIYQQSKWFVSSQGDGLLAICSVPLASSTQVETFGSSGADVTQLLQNSNANVQILLITSLTPHNNVLQAKKNLRSGIALTTALAQNVTMTLDTENGSNSYVFAAATAMVWLNNAQQVVTFQNNSLQTVTFQGGGFKLPDQDTEGMGKFIGNTVSGLVQQLSVNLIIDEYVDIDPWGKSP